MAKLEKSAGNLCFFWGATNPCHWHQAGAGNYLGANFGWQAKALEPPGRALNLRAWSEILSSGTSGAGREATCPERSASSLEKNARLATGNTNGAWYTPAWHPGAEWQRMPTRAGPKHPGVDGTSLAIEFLPMVCGTKMPC